MRPSGSDKATPTCKDKAAGAEDAGFCFRSGLRRRHKVGLLSSSGVCLGRSGSLHGLVALHGSNQDLLGPHVSSWQFSFLPSALRSSAGMNQETAGEEKKPPPVKRVRYRRGLTRGPACVPCE